MRSLPTASRRTLALGLLAALATPLLGLSHLHDVPDHDGVAHHIEDAHGHHLPVLADADDRRPSTGFDLSAAPLPAHTLSSEAPSAARADQVQAAGRLHAARGPPGVQRSRAPPHHS